MGRGGLLQILPPVSISLQFSHFSWAASPLRGIDPGPSLSKSWDLVWCEENYSREVNSRWILQGGGSASDPHPQGSSSLQLSRTFFLTGEVNSRRIPGGGVQGHLLLTPHPPILFFFLSSPEPHVWHGSWALTFKIMRFGMMSLENYSAGVNSRRVMGGCPGGPLLIPFPRIIIPPVFFSS